LLLLCRRSITAQDILAIQDLLRSGLDWELILATSDSEGVYPLVYDNLRNLGFDYVPAQVREQLTAWYRVNAFRSQAMVEELHKALSALAHADIPAIPLKGMALAQLLYGDVSMRASSDLDILVPRDLAKRGLQVLRDIGYEPRFPRFERESIQRYIESALMRETPVAQWVVELHWAVLWDSSADKLALDDLWRESVPDTFFGARGMRMSPEWEFLLLAVHAARSHWQGMKWLADIHDMCTLLKLDWQRIQQKASAFGWTTLVRGTLAACNTLFGTTAPPELALAGTTPLWLKLFPAKPSEFSRNFLPLHWVEGNSAKLRYLARVLLVQTPAEWELIYLPRYARLFYTPLRLARLAAKWTPRVVRRAAGHE
jgi:hypothetical protein